MRFKRKYMQPCRPCRRSTPSLPKSQEIITEAKAGFAHREAVSALPTFGQTIAFYEDMTRLLQSAGSRVVDVPVAFACRRTVCVKMQTARLQGLMAGPHVSRLKQS